MWLNESSKYKYLSSDAVKRAEDNLQLELNELKKEIETNELVHGISFSRSFTSVPIPKDAPSLARERKLYIEKLLKIHDVRKTHIQSDVMLEELENALKDEYTFESLPLIMNQFYLDRISWSVHAKHSHLLRWKRFNEHSNAIENNYVNYKNRLGYILSEYNDSLQRSQRLSVARETLLNSGSCSSVIQSVQVEDMLIYLRWLVCHFYAQKSFIQAMKTIEWLPYQMSIDAQCNKNDRSLHISTSLNSPSLEQTSEMMENSSLINPAQHKQSSYSVASMSNTKNKLLENIYFPSSNAVSSQQDAINTISFCNKKHFYLFISTQIILFFPFLFLVFNQDEIPVHDNSLEYLLPRLQYLVSHYKVDYVRPLIQLHLSRFI